MQIKYLTRYIYWTRELERNAMNILRIQEIALLDGLTTRLASGDISVIHVKSVLNGVCKLEMGLLPLSDTEFLGRVLKKLINVLRDVLDDVISGELIYSSTPQV